METVKAYERVEIRRQQDEEQKQAELFSGTAFPAALSGPGQPATKTTVELKSLLNRQLYSRMLPFSGIRILAGWSWKPA